MWVRIPPGPQNKIFMKKILLFLLFVIPTVSVTQDFNYDLRTDSCLLRPVHRDWSISDSLIIISSIYDDNVNAKLTVTASYIIMDNEHNKILGYETVLGTVSLFFVKPKRYPVALMIGFERDDFYPIILHNNEP